jgi:dimethylhistidine N-methyltransferase
MTKPAQDNTYAMDRGQRDAFAAAVTAGLAGKPKTLPTAYLYDARGSALFEDITQLDAYYQTRTEMRILRQHAAEWVAQLAPGTVLVEFGSGSSRKTEIVLSAAPAITHYAPIDVSEAALEGAIGRLSSRFPDLRIVPLVGDFRTVTLPPELASHAKAGFFPGSTIGNFTPERAVELLRSFGRLLGPGGALLIGVDLQKDTERLIRAYDDEEGVTAAFNLNLLRHINRELDGNFVLDAFEHVAIYNSEHDRIEMHLAAKRDQVVAVAGERFTVRANERIHTENSYKYSIDGFAALAERAGWETNKVWTDSAELFSVHALVFGAS